MGRAKRIDCPMIVFAMCDQCADADNRVVQVLGELVTDCRADFFVGLTVMTVCSSKSFYVRNSLQIPDENMRGHVGPSATTANDLILRRQDQRFLQEEAAPNRSS